MAFDIFNRSREEIVFGGDFIIGGYCYHFSPGHIVYERGVPRLVPGPIIAGLSGPCIDREDATEAIGGFDDSPYFKGLMNF